MAYRRTATVQARLDAQRETVLRSAMELLAERGYSGCSMAAVAERAGIATGSLYQHFAGKTDLSVELFRTVVTHEVEAVTAAAARWSDPRRRATAVLETFAARALQSPRLAYALLAEPADAAVDAERLVFRRTFRDLLAAQIAAGVDSGLLPEQDPGLTAAALVGAVGEALVGPLAAGSPPDEVLPALTVFILRAMGAPAATPVDPLEGEA